MRSVIRRLLWSPLIWTAIASVLVVESLVVLRAYSVERSRLRAAERDVTNPYFTSIRFIPLVVPGLQEPKILPASAAKIADAEPVIGIDVKGKTRAYLLRALSYPPWHVVNDVIDGTPASVTYCDQNSCTRVYTDRGDSSRPLDVAVAGLYGREMIVKVQGRLFLQETQDPFEMGVEAKIDEAISFPYAVHPYERTTWNKWRHRHPQTDVFVGQGDYGSGP